MNTKPYNNLYYLAHSGIDTGKWDQCMAAASNQRVYGFSWYLNLTAGVWDALVWDDYKYIMPLPVRKKFTVPYVYQPFFTQQLGIYPPAPEDIRKIFATRLAAAFPYLDYQAGTSCDFSFSDTFRITLRNNRFLPLTPDYDTLRSGFSENTRRNIRYAAGEGVIAGSSLNPEVYLQRKQDSVTGKAAESSFLVLRKLMEESLARGVGRIIAACDRDGEILSAAFLLSWEDRLYYLNAYSSLRGKELKAAFAIVDKVITDHAATCTILDFEGSEVAGVDRFYRGFGALTEPYLLIRMNRLPGFLRLLKQGPW